MKKLPKIIQNSINSFESDKEGLINHIVENTELSKFQKLVLFEKHKLMGIDSYIIDDFQDAIDMHGDLSRYQVVDFTDMIEWSKEDVQDEIEERAYSYALKNRICGFHYDW